MKTNKVNRWSSLMRISRGVSGPMKSAVGKHIAYDSPTWHEIIGVVPAVKILRL